MLGHRRWNIIIVVDSIFILSRHTNIWHIYTQFIPIFFLIRFIYIFMNIYRARSISMNYAIFSARLAKCDINIHFAQSFVRHNRTHNSYICMRTQYIFNLSNFFANLSRKICTSFHAESNNLSRIIVIILIRIIGRRRKKYIYDFSSSSFVLIGSNDRIVAVIMHTKDPTHES